MRYTIKAARYANDDHTSAVIETEEAGAVAISEADTPDEWQALHGASVEIVPFAEPPATFFASDFLAKLTPDDYAAIQAATASSPALGLLWASMLAQGGPISTGSERFTEGWAGLSQALGSQRAAQLATALGLNT